LYKIFYTQNEYFGLTNSIFNFNFLGLAVSEIRDIRGGVPIGPPSVNLGPPPNISETARPRKLKLKMLLDKPLGRPLAEKFLYQCEYFTISNCVFNFKYLAL